MKVNLIQYDMLKHKCSEPGCAPKQLKGRNGMSMSDGNLYNTGYCGSFTGKSEAATSFLDKILKNNWFGNFAKYAHEHNISGSALIALVLAGVMRPATIMALPGDKDKDDKIYASGHAMASGIMGFIVSTAITSPFDESIKKVFADNSKFVGKKLKSLSEKIEVLKAKKLAKTITAEELEKLKSLASKRQSMQTLAKNIPDWIIAVPRAMLTVALIPPILKYVFGLEKKKKNENKDVININNQNFVNSNIIDKPVFAAFKGGVK